MIKNQFILTRNLFSDKSENKIAFGSYNFYYHKNVKVSLSENETVKILVVGNLYDWENIHWDNSKILNSWLIDNNIDFFSILKKSYKYSGEYLVLYYDKNNDKLKIFTDTAAQYELFYTVTDYGEIVASSNHKLISEITPLKEDNTPDAYEFYNSKAFLKKRAFILNDTNYVNLKRLNSNHYLDINNGKSIRYFPNEKIKKTTITEVSLKCSKMIKGYIHAAAYRKQLLIPVTSGWDSRLLLAASKEVSEKMVYHLFLIKKKIVPMIKASR